MKARTVLSIAMLAAAVSACNEDILGPHQDRISKGTSTAAGKPQVKVNREAPTEGAVGTPIKRPVEF